MTPRNLRNIHTNRNSCWYAFPCGNTTTTQVFLPADEEGLSHYFKTSTTEQKPDWLRVQKPLILKGRHHVCMAKNITFLSRNQQVLNSNLAITTGKRSLLKIWTNLRFTNFSQKSKVYGNNCSKPKIDINFSHTRKYTITLSRDTEGGCLE